MPSSSPGMLTAMQHSPLSPTAATTAGHQYIDYSAYAAAAAGLQPAGLYDGYSPYTTAANGYVTPAAAFTAYTVPPTMTAGGHAIHYQGQQIQATERMQ